MGNERQDRTLESAHICPTCGYATLLAEMDLGAITTGIVNCSNCDWAGQIVIEIIDTAERKRLS